jgi:hypothetical protein
MVTAPFRALVLVAAALAAAGSATVIKGTSQPVTIMTTPSNAQVFVDRKLVGTSPLRLDISHGDHVVSASLPGYRSGYARLTASFSGWTLLNAFTGVVTILVDAVTGSIATLDQSTVIIELAPAAASPGAPAARH